MPHQKLHRKSQQGSTLLLVLGLGLITTLMGMGLMMQSLKGRAIAAGRKDSGQATAITEGGIARTLALLKQPQNAALLTRNYDPINPRTGKTYLGTDGSLNSGDEGTTAINEWESYDPSGKPCFQVMGIGSPSMPTNGTIGGGSYVLRAYRYVPGKQVGIVLVEGSQAGQSNAIAVSFSLIPNLDNFPGIVAVNNQTINSVGKLALRGRAMLGRNANVYYPPDVSATPALTGVSRPGDASRPGYLDAILSGPSDGATSDTVEGNIVACELVETVPVVPQGTNLGVITSSQSLAGVPGGITYFRASTIKLSGTDILAVDTTDGPVSLFVEGLMPGGAAIELTGQAKIVNSRRDGNSPRVGDLRIYTTNWDGGAILKGQSCIQSAFLYLFGDNLELYTDGPGCTNSRNTNFEGVVWAELIASAKQDASNRDLGDLGNPSSLYGNHHNGTIVLGASSGIYVPDDVTSLIDLLPYINWPIRYQFGEIKSWQRQRL
jgi:hypothetical protein